MKALMTSLFIVALSFNTYAQEQLAVRLNESGILKVLKMAIKYNNTSKSGEIVNIPKNLYKFTLPKEKILSNPIIPVINEISDLNLNEDLPFYLNTSQINISGIAVEESLNVKILNSNSTGFDVKLSIRFPEVNVHASDLFVCEKANEEIKECDDGLKLQLQGLSILTKGKPVELSTVLGVKTDGQLVRVSVKSVSSNLHRETAPELVINFDKLHIPKITLVINNTETEIDTSQLKGEILKRSDFLAQSLLGFVANFIADDLAEMMNVYFLNKSVPTSYLIFKREKLTNYNELLDQTKLSPKSIASLEYSQIVPNIDDPLSSMMTKISDIMRNAQLGISLKSITAIDDRDIELAGIIEFILNKTSLQVNNTFGNSNRKLPPLNLKGYREHDLNLAISEPLINGALDLVNSTNLYQKVLESVAKVPGFSINSVKAHFYGKDSIVVVVNSQVDLHQIESKGFSGWLRKRIATWLERNNNRGIIYFPIEVGVTPLFQQLPNGDMEMSLKVHNPFQSDVLLNRFSYPSNVPEMTATVKSAVMKQLKSSLEQYTDKVYKVDLSKFLNQSGVVFRPKDISIYEGGYFLLNLDISDIKFNSKNILNR